MNTAADDWQASTRVDLDRGDAEVRLAAPRFMDFEVAADAKVFAEGVRPWIDVMHRYPGGTWSHAGHQTSWKAERRADGTIVWRVSEAPEGPYLVRLFAKGHASSTIELDLKAAGAPVVVRVSPGPVVAPIDLVYDGPALTRDHFFTLSGMLREQHDVESGTFAGKPPAATVTQARPGRYVLTLWRSECAMLLDLPESGERRFAVSVPTWTAPASGPDLTVVVAKDGIRVTRLMVAIAPASDAPLASGKWFRSCDSWPGKFAGVAPGDWDVFVFDGVYGEWLGIAGSPRVQRVHVGAEPVTVSFDL